MMDQKLEFKTHRELTKKKCMNALGFVRRQCRNKFSSDVSLLLYNALVRSIAEFASVIWSPFCSTHKNELESIQKQAVIFIRGDYISRAENEYVLTPYIDRCLSLKLSTLARRRVNTAALFMHKIISNRIDAPALRSQLELNTGIRTLRRPEFIKIKRCKTDYSLNAPFTLACRAFNHAALFIDPTLPLHQFREKLLRLPDSAFNVLSSL